MIRPATLSVAAVIALAAALPGRAEAFAPPTTKAQPIAAAPTFAQARLLLLTYCGRCHNPDDPQGGVDLRSITEAAVPTKRGLWRRAGRRIRTGEMPPEDAKQPTAAEKAVLLRWLAGAERADVPADLRDPGPSVLRRLSRREYLRTVRDLFFGLPEDALRDLDLPEEPAGEHFDNLAVTLTVSSSLMERYFAAAEKVADRLFMRHWWADRARKALLVPAPGGKVGDRDAAKQIITRLVRRAFRKPASSADVDRLLKLYDRARAAKGGPGASSFEQGIKAVIKPVLVSPQFLFRVEANRPARGRSPGVAVDDHELAVRLSYFLWSSMPDDALFKLADEGKLSGEAELARQVRRMLADPKASALTDGFAAGWLQLDKLRTARPTQEFFPAFDDKLRRAMREEMTAFFDHVRTADRSLLEFLDADYTFVNEPLAKLYGLGGVRGEKMQKVALRPEHHRGGLLGMAGALTLTSHTFRTSPTLRGKYVLEVILGTPPPPPPPDAGMLKDDKPAGNKKQPKTFRELMAAHASQPSCAGCHRKIDPLGFTLENYDAIGAWREGTRERPLDNWGALAGGQKMVGVAGLKKVLLSRHKDDFARNLSEQMLVYALGRLLGSDDEAAVREVRAGLAKGEYKFSALVSEVVRSTPFRQRRAAAVSSSTKG